jgi:hypothetical protein
MLARPFRVMARTEPRVVFRSDQIWSASLSRAVSSIAGFPPTLQRKKTIDLLPKHSLLMKGELPSLFLTFAFLINGEKEPVASKDIGGHYSLQPAFTIHAL